MGSFLVLLERCQWVGFNGICFMILRPNMHDILIFEYFCHENSNKLEKSGFERKNQLNNAFKMHNWRMYS
jgi:hypothetical protein